MSVMSINGDEFETEDPIQDFINNAPYPITLNVKDDGDDNSEKIEYNAYFKSLINVLELSHITFLHKRKEFIGDFTGKVVIPRIQMFNDLIKALNNASLDPNVKNLYRRHVDLYSSSLDDNVFQQVKKLNSKKENNNFWIKSFNTSVIYKLFNELDKHKNGLDIMQTNLISDFQQALERAMTSVETKTKHGKDKTKIIQQLIKPGDEKEELGSEGSEGKTELSFNNKEAYKKMCTFYSKSGHMFASYYEFHKRFFLNHVLLQRSYINALNSWIDELGDENQSPLYTYYSQFRKEINRLNDELTIMIASSFSFIGALGIKLTDANNELTKIKRGLTETEQTDIDERRSVANNMQLLTVNKINTLYNNTSAMAVILDNQFTYMYILKIITYGLMYLGLFFAEKIFSDMYTKAVYVKNQEPPNLLTFYGIYLGFAVAMMLFIIVVLYIVSQIFNSPLNGYIAINNDLIIKYIIDMCVFHVLTGAILCVIGGLMQRKKYFKYKTEGPRAIRAFSESISIISAITILIPYFLVF